MIDKLVGMNRNLRIFLLFSGFFVSAIIMFVSGDNWLIFFILSAVFLITLIKTNIMYDENLRNNFDNLAKETLSENNFNYDEIHIGDDRLSAIAISEQNEQMAILHRNSLNEQFILSPIDFSKIIESSINEDGETVSKSSKGQVIGGAVIGGVIAGGIGTVVGALGADKTLKDTVKRISLTVVVDDLKNPVYELNFMNAISSIDKSNPLYKDRYSKVNKWHKMISVILKRNEINSNSV